MSYPEVPASLSATSEEMCLTLCARPCQSNDSGQEQENGKDYDVDDDDNDDDLVKELKWRKTRKRRI